MSNAQPDYYGTLGVPPGATQDEIKKKYRALARQYHPDINPSPEAAQKIKEINEAYHVLGDSERRSVYDAHRVLAQKPPPTYEATTRLRPEDIPPSARTPRTESPVNYNGFGTVPDPAARPYRQPPGSPSARRAAPPPRTHPLAHVERLVREAQLAFVNRNYREAEGFCQQAITLDRHNATAYEILADICVKKGQQERACTYYTYAIQFNPRNVTAQVKLDRLLGVNERRGPTMTRPLETNAWDRMADASQRDTVLYAFSLVLLIGFFGMCFLLKLHPGLPITNALSIVDGISFNLLGALAFNGIIAGILLALFGGMRPITEELLAHESLHGQRTPISLGVVLTGFALVFFYASFLVYVGIALAKNRFSLSILRAYGMTLLLTVLFAILYLPPSYPQGGIQVAALGGNLLFPAILFGWAVGDALRLNRA
jgi:tetratricopeptide (TPR) repeat protein